MISEYSYSKRGEARSQKTDQVQLRMKTNSPNPTYGDNLLELVTNTQKMTFMFNQEVYTTLIHLCFTWDK